MNHLRYKLDFKFAAGTSRGVYREKDTWIIQLMVDDDPALSSFGEAAPLVGLSPDPIKQMDEKLEQVSKDLEAQNSWPSSIEAVNEWANRLAGESFPSIRFALEMAGYQLLNKQSHCVFDNDFFQGNRAIPINGLIWMGDKKFMRDQVEKKLDLGFTCIKMKIGALDFETELELLQYIKSFDQGQLTLRVDANGAFAPQQAMERLKRLSDLNLHSIEQPIKAGQWEQMADLCRQTPLPIALDEELIGVHSTRTKAVLLDTIQPQFIILKPTLVGGIASTREWIALAEERGIGWWMTSALESNIGLNAIAQLTSTYSTSMPQGLGTGQLYHNNVPSPLTIQHGFLSYMQNKPWDTSLIHWKERGATT